MIIPKLQTHLLKLFGQLLVNRALKWCKLEIRRTFNHWLTLTIKGKDTVVALIGTKLLRSNYHSQSLTVTHKNCALARSNENYTILAVIYVYVGRHVKYEKMTVFAVLYIELLLLDRPYLFHSKCIVLIREPIVLRVVFLFYYLGLENVCIEFRLFLNRFFILTGLSNANHLLLLFII
jgi:hypothetical protein